MKKVLFIAVIAMFGLSSINAQNVRLGAKAGVNFATFSGDDTDDMDYVTSFHAGIVSEVMISNRFSFQPELLYSKQGASDTYEDEFGKLETTYDLSYLNMPLMIKFYIAEGFSIQAGPQIGLLLDAELESDITNKLDPTRNLETTENIKDELNKTDYGVNFGITYQFDNGLNFGARYNLGLSNINEGEDKDEFKQHNNVIQASVGFMF